MIGWHVEVVSPGVFSAIQAWYCGGPRITRTVISTDVVGKGTGLGLGGTELELFPLRLVVCTCDERGSTIDHPPQGNHATNPSINNRHHRKDESTTQQFSPVRELLVSKAATVGDLLREIVRLDNCQAGSNGSIQGLGSGSSLGSGQGHASAGASAVILPSAMANVMPAAADVQTNPLGSNGKVNDGASIDISHVRLWNYAPVHWQQQFVLGQGLGHPQLRPGQPYANVDVDELTLEAARLQCGQRLLLERRLVDGTWPRQRLQEAFEQQAADNEAAASATNATGAATNSSSSSSNAVDNSNTPNNQIDEASATTTTTDATALQPWNARRVNEGKVGLENLGNTCYLNSSVQVRIYASQYEYVSHQHYSL